MKENSILPRWKGTGRKLASIFCQITIIFHLFLSRNIYFADIIKRPVCDAATGLSQLNNSSTGASDISKFKFPVQVKGSMCTLSSLYFDFKINWYLKNSRE